MEPWTLFYNPVTLVVGVGLFFGFVGAIICYFSEKREEKK